MAASKSTSKTASKSSARKTAPSQEPEAAARNREAAAARVAGKASPDVTHDANPDSDTDSSVRHAEPQTGKLSGEGHGGYPTGEYDVVNTATGKTATGTDALATTTDVSVERTKRQSEAPSDLPIGAIVEKEGLDRWRVHVGGQNQWGFGKTLEEAVKDYHAPATIIQPNVPLEEQESFKALPSSVQAEVKERDRIAQEYASGTAPKQTERSK